MEKQECLGVPWCGFGVEWIVGRLSDVDWCGLECGGGVAQSVMQWGGELWGGMAWN